MEEFIKEIEAYCAKTGLQPQQVLRRSLQSSWGVWAEWKAGTTSPTLRSADRVRDWMQENPEPQARRTKDVA
jgi:hypothetical protein